MSVLFQALERAANEGRPQQTAPGGTYLHGVAAHRRSGTGLAFVIALFIAGALGALGAVGFMQTQGDATGAEHALSSLKGHDTTLLAASSITPSKPTKQTDSKQEEKNYLGTEEIPPDLAQGITLSSPVGVTTLPDKETATVMQKLQDAPVFTKTKKKKEIEIEVRDRVPPELLKKAQESLVSGQYKEALDLYDEALETDPDHETALAGKAAALQQTGQYDEAIRIEEALFAKNPNDFAVKGNLVDALASRGTDEALARLKAIADKEKAFAPVQVALAKVLGARGDVQKAVGHLRRAMELEPKNAAYCLNLAVLLDRAGEGHDALEAYRQVWSMKDDAKTSLPLTWDAIEQRIAYLASK